MSIFEKSQSLNTLRPYNHSRNLLQLDDDGNVSATADESEFDSPFVYFYVVPGADFPANVLQYQFKPYCQSDKYIAVVDGKVALKAENECTESQRSFYIRDWPNGYLSFYVSAGESIYYLGCKNDKKLCACAEKLDKAMWFFMRKKDDETILAEKSEMYFETSSRTEVITEIVVTEE